MYNICPFIALVLFHSLLSPLSFSYAQDQPVPGTRETETIFVSVSSIIDGDSLMVKKNRREIEIRLWGIDTPEYNQPGAKEASTALSSILLGQEIEIEIVDRDKYGRLVAIAQKGSLNINEYMVRSGHAWVHVYYCKAVQCKKWYEFEQAARLKRIGIWKYDKQVPPWKWKASKQRL